MDNKVGIGILARQLTPKEIQRIRTLVKTYRIKEVSKMTHHSVKTIVKYCRGMRPKFPPPFKMITKMTLQKKRRTINLFRQWKNPSEIAKILGMSRYTIMRHLKGVSRKCKCGCGTSFIPSNGQLFLNPKHKRKYLNRFRFENYLGALTCPFCGQFGRIYSIGRLAQFGKWIQKIRVRHNIGSHWF